ncbi:MAG: HAD hydrolase family protein [Clostridia bacterium]|nr:HAD hydrolase family protein [Clostridia bacterium]
MEISLPERDGAYYNCLICSDIDMTFYSKDGVVPERNRRELRRYMERGGLFTFASGRNNFDLPLIIPDLENTVNVPAVLCNGSLFFDVKSRKASDETFLDAKRAKKLFREASDLFPDVGFRLTTRDGFLVPERQTRIIKSLEDAGLIGITRLAPIEEITGEETYKAVFIAAADALPPLITYIKENYGDVFDVTASTKWNTELQPKGVTKAVGVKKLKEAVKKYRPDIKLFCIGDYYNDIEMLEAADTAVCPENAADEVKAVCDAVLCECGEGAVGDLIERIGENLPL